MSGYEDLWPLLCLQGRAFSESLSQTIAMANISCRGTDAETCRDKSAALDLKFVAIAAILVSSVVGVAIPLVGKHWRFLRTGGSLFVATKAFAAGVILATGFVHMLPGGSSALSDPCLPESPWSKFPFAGFFAMTAALVTLLVDLVGIQYYERKQRLTRASKEKSQIRASDSGLESGIMAVDDDNVCNGTGHVHAHGHGHGSDQSDDEDRGSRHVVVSQILELGIVSHSVIIGLSLGVSESPCTIRPLIAALSFHQFFEGFALGGCISQAQFKTLPATIMACFYAITTPAGIAAGLAVSSFYNPNSVGALVVEGTLNSLSAGILIYMALVDLIAADFLSKTMSRNLTLQVVSYFMLFLGAGMMSVLAIWA